MQSTRKTGPTLFPRAQKAGSKATPAFEPDLFQYLCKAGKNGNQVSETLVRYGQRNVHILPLRGRLDTRDLTDQDATFLITLQFTEANKRANKALVENVQRQASFVDKMHAQLLDPQPCCRRYAPPRRRPLRQVPAFVPPVPSQDACADAGHRRRVAHTPVLCADVCRFSKETNRGVHKPR